MSVIMAIFNQGSDPARDNQDILSYLGCIPQFQGIEVNGYFDWFDSFGCDGMPGLVFKVDDPNISSPDLYVVIMYPSGVTYGDNTIPVGFDSDLFGMQIELCMLSLFRYGIPSGLEESGSRLGPVFRLIGLADSFDKLWD